jgi:signal transduction histidine kinase
VAAQWRIRHKLLLELGLMVAVMALVLAGTVRGLWAYYQTTDAIKAKHAELKAAEEFKDAVAALISPDSLRGFARFPAGVKLEVQKARDLLDRFARQLQDGIEHGQHPDDCRYEQLMVPALEKRLNEFEQAVCAAPPGMRRPGDDLEPPADDPDAAAGGDGTDRVREAMKARAEDRPAPARAGDATDRVREAVRGLRIDTGDLHDTINDELDRHLKETRRHYQTATKIIVPASVLGLVVLAAILMSFYTWVFHPIRDLQAGVVRVARGDFTHRIEVHSGDEMEELAEAFNDMTGRLQELYGDLARQVNERSRQLVRSERLASVGFLAAGVAHEINNPLASIAFCSEALEARLADLVRVARASGRPEDCEVFTKYLKMIQEEAFRCKNITERLLEFSRTGERRREEADLGALVQSVLDLTRHLQNSRGKEIELRVHADRVPGGRILARVNAEEIKSVVLNLVVNALDSMDEGGRLTIALGQRDGMAELTFTDTGCGMTQDVLDNIFEPFFTRSRSGKGTGLGLTISHRIVTQHGGELEAASNGPTRGSTFTVRLPLRPAETPDAPPAEAPPPRLRAVHEARQAA